MFTQGKILNGKQNYIIDTLDKLEKKEKRKWGKPDGKYDLTGTILKLCDLSLRYKTHFQPEFVITSFT